MSQPLFDAAVAAYQAGRFPDCEQLCRTALKVHPDDEDLLVLHAMALQSSGQVDAAADVFRKLTGLRPEVPEYWSNLGLMLRHLGRTDEAETMFQRALGLPHPPHDTLVNYGLLLLDMGRIADARHRFLDAVDVEQDSAEARIYAALACMECGDTRRAEALIPSSHTWPALDPALRRDLTKALIQLGRVKDAETILEIDVEHAQDPIAMARLASLHERTNRVESASILLERIRPHLADGDPDVQVDAWALDAALALRDKDYPRAAAAAQSLLATRNLPPSTQANTHFTMAKIADKQGDQDLAMAELAQAHAIQFRLASGMEPEIAASIEEPLRIAAKWLQPEESAFAPMPGDPGADRSPVFIVGFPRSGTTMLEQMLDAHPAYVSMDERIIIQACVERMEAKGFNYPHQLDRLDEEDLKELRTLYWTEANKVAARTEGQILVDKNPLNMLRLPMIRRLFPSARVILALRHPCDVILSCYMQNFRSPAFMILCSTLERLTKSYVNAMRFWIHHQPLLCPDALLLRYEDTVGDFAGQVERIADYLGISERHHLADFAAHAARKGYISTPSYAQVTEPVNSRAVARWEPYRAFFEPLFPLLRPVAGHWRYALEGDR